MSDTDLLSIATIALLGSFGHCVGMCGGIVVAYSSTKIDKTISKLGIIFSHLVYSLGRITTYVTLGGIFGALGSVATLSHTANAVLYLIAGVFMIFASFEIFGKINFLRFLEHSVYSQKWYKNAFNYLIKNKNLGSFYLLGVLNGLIPCGFVYLFAVSAAASASVGNGMLIMLIFGLSTVPALFSLGFFVGFLKEKLFRNLLMKLTGMAVLLYGIYTMYKSLIFFINADSSLLHCH